MSGLSGAQRAVPMLLFVEDDRDALVTSAQLFRAIGFAVEIARGGEEGFARAIELGPDVIVTDIVMPQVSGADLCARLRTTPTTRSIPIIAYTGITDAKALAKLYRLGVRVFAIKPCVPTVIGDEARELLAETAGRELRIVTGYGELLDDLAREVETCASQDAE